jgi:hypothetical protein
MADTKITALAVLTGASVASGDELVIVDVSDIVDGRVGHRQEHHRGELATALGLIGGVPLGMYGDGSDGNVTISSGTTTLARDMFYDTLTISGGTLKPNGFRVYARTKIDQTGGTIDQAGSPGPGGAGTNRGSLDRGTPGGSGGSAGAGTAGTAAIATLGGLGGTGGISGAGQAGGAGGTATAPGAALGSVRTTPQAFLGMFLGQASGAFSSLPLGGGSGGGGGGGSGAGGNGGGGGGPIVLAAPIINLAGTLTAVGGAGQAGQSGNGGGGGGGGGGVILLVCHLLTGTTPTAAGNATGGAGGAGIGSGATGGTGANGTVIIVKNA